MSNTTKANKAALKAATILSGETGVPVNDTTDNVVSVDTTPKAKPNDAARNDKSIMPSADVLATFDVGQKLIAKGGDLISQGRQVLSYALMSYYMTQRGWDDTTALNVGRSPKDASAFRTDNVSLFILRQASRPSQNYKGMTSIQRIAAEMAFEEFHTKEQRMSGASNLMLALMASGVTCEHWDASAKRWRIEAHRYCEHNTTPTNDADAFYVMPTGPSKKSSIPVVLRIDGAPEMKSLVKTDATSFMQSAATRFRQAGDWLGAATLAKQERAPHNNDTTGNKAATAPQPSTDGKVATDTTTTDKPAGAAAAPAAGVAPMFTENNTTSTQHAPQLPTAGVSGVTVKPDTRIDPAKTLADLLINAQSHLLNALNVMQASSVDGLGYMSWQKFTNELTPDARKALIGITRVCSGWNKHLTQAKQNAEADAKAAEAKAA